MTPDWAPVVGAGVVCAFWATWFVLSRRRDPRRLRNGFLLIAVVYTGTGLLHQLVDRAPGGAEVMDWVSFAWLAVLGLGLLVLPVLVVEAGGVIVLGSKVTGGRVPPLLASLLRTGLEAAWRVV